MQTLRLRFGVWLRALALSTALFSGRAWAVATIAGQPDPVASYRFIARLDCENHTINASGTIRFTNQSSATLTELWFHLYPNAFSHEKTRFLRMAAGTRRSRHTRLDFPGSLQIIRLSVNDAEGPDIWVQAEPSTPGDPDDATDRRVPLPKPLLPTQTIELYVQFITRLPFLIERMGWVEDFHAAAQWFPKLARLETDGTWRHFPYEPLAEFSSDFGDYDLSIDAPEQTIVAAPGDRTIVAHHAGRQTTRFQLNGAHDIAFFAWNRFVETDVERNGIQIRLFAPPGHSRNVGLELQTVAFGFQHFQAQYGPYPYRQFVIVHPPDVAAPAGGMEYPGLIVTGGPWYLSWTGARSLQAVTLHELAHQWFYGIIANDEARFPVLDEGLATWAELDGLSNQFGISSAFSGFGVTVSANAVAEAAAIVRAEAGPLAKAASEFHSFRELAATVYARTATLMNTFANVYGQATLERALRRYALSERYSHPSPQSLIDAVAAEMGPEPARNLRTAMIDNGWIDYRVSQLTTRKEDRDRWYSSVTLSRIGSLSFPVDVAMTLQSGRVIHRAWPPDIAELNLSVTDFAPIENVLIDPENRVTIESNRLNNSRWRDRPSKPVILLNWLTCLFQWLLWMVMP